MNRRAIPRSELRAARINSTPPDWPEHRENQRRRLIRIGYDIASALPYPEAQVRRLRFGMTLGGDYRVEPNLNYST